MKCPLREVPKFDEEGEAHFQQADCLQEECHWWSRKYSHCAILGYEEACDRLSKTLKELSSKIPMGGAK